MSAVKYPQIQVQLSGNDGNAYAIMSSIQKALRRAEIPQHEIEQYLNQSMSGDYDNLLRVAMNWVTVH